jgi:hypothetical protein
MGGWKINGRKIMSTIVKVVVGMALGYGIWTLKNSEITMEDRVVNLLKSNRFKKIRQALQPNESAKG